VESRQEWAEEIFVYFFLSRNMSVLDCKGEGDAHSYSNVYFDTA
jgi:hypothetical protein